MSKQLQLESVIEINSATLTLSTMSVENHFANCARHCVICFLQYKGQACTSHWCERVGGCLKIASPEHLQPLHPHQEYKVAHKSWADPGRI